MTEHQEAEVENNEEESTRDSRIDAISAVVLILLAVSAIVYYVANM